MLITHRGSTAAPTTKAKEGEAPGMECSKCAADLPPTEPVYHPDCSATASDDDDQNDDEDRDGETARSCADCGEPASPPVVCRDCKRGKKSGDSDGDALAVIDDTVAKMRQSAAREKRWRRSTETAGAKISRPMTVGEARQSLVRAEQVALEIAAAASRSSSKSVPPQSAPAIVDKISAEFARARGEAPAAPKSLPVAAAAPRLSTPKPARNTAARYGNLKPAQRAVADELRRDAVAAGLDAHAVVRSYIERTVEPVASLIPRSRPLASKAPPASPKSKGPRDWHSAAGPAGIDLATKRLGIKPTDHFKIELDHGGRVVEWAEYSADGKLVGYRTPEVGPLASHATSSKGA